MRFLYGLIGFWLGTMLSIWIAPTAPRQYHLLAVAIMVAGAMAGGD